MRRKMQMQKRKKQGKHKSIEKFPHVEGGEINKILCGQILNMGELICRKALSYCYFSLVLFLSLQ